MADLMTNKQMEGKPAIEQAKLAIRNALQQIKDNRTIGWHMGFGSQSFALLTEAAATLWGRPVEEVRENFMPRAAKNPLSDFTCECTHCERTMTLDESEYGRCPRCGEFMKLAPVGEKEAE